MIAASSEVGSAWAMNSDNVSRPVPRPSEHVQVITGEGQYLLYHSVDSSYAVLDGGDYEFFRRLESIDEHDAADILAGREHLVARLLSRGLLQIQSDRTFERNRADLLNWLDRLDGMSCFDALSIILLQECNLACTYCIRDRAIANTRRGLTVVDSDASSSVVKMSIEVAERVVDRYVTQLAPSGRRKLHISFNGSEPMANRGTFLHVLDYVEGNYGSDYDVAFHVNTNCTLVSEEVASRMSRSRFTVYTSLDGPRVVHDRRRPTRSGRPTFDAVLEGINLLRKHAIPIHGFLSVVGDDNLASLDDEFFEWQRDNGFSVLTLEPDMLSIASIGPSEMARRLVGIHHRAGRFGIAVRGSWYRPFRELMSGRGRRVPLSPYCGSQAGEVMAVDAEGKIMPCAFSATILGSDGDPGAAFGRVVQHAADRFPGNIAACKGCAIEGLCRGGCWIVAENANIRGEQEVRRQRCELYRAATDHLLKSSIPLLASRDVDAS